MTETELLQAILTELELQRVYAEAQWEIFWRGFGCAFPFLALAFTLRMARRGSRAASY